NAGTETLALLERRRSFVVPALRRLAATALRDRNRGNAAVRTHRHVALAEEAAIGAVKLRGAAENTTVTPQRGRHMNLIHRIALEHVILSDQTVGAFREKNFVAELDRHAHFAALDEIGMRLEDRIDLFSRGHLFAIEHAAACLVDHPRAEIAIMRDLIAKGLDLQGGQRVPAAHRSG